MTDYVLIESRDPFESNDTPHFCSLAENLAHAGHSVTLFLVQNGVFPARPNGASAALHALMEAGVELLADEFSLAERGIDATCLTPGVAPARLDTLVDRLASGHKAIWH